MQLVSLDHPVHVHPIIYGNYVDHFHTPSDRPKKTPKYINIHLFI